MPDVIQESLVGLVRQVEQAGVVDEARRVGVPQPYDRFVLEQIRP